MISIGKENEKMFIKKEKYRKQIEEAKMDYARKRMEDQYVFSIKEFNKHMESLVHEFWRQVANMKKNPELYYTVNIVESEKFAPPSVPYVYRIIWDKLYKISFVMFSYHNDVISIYIMGGTLNNPGGTGYSCQPALNAKIYDRDNKIVIDNICCQEVDRGKGYGTALLQALIDFAKELNIDYIEGKLNEADENDPENHKRRDALYKKMGFVFNGKYVIKDIPKE